MLIIKWYVQIELDRNEIVNKSYFLRFARWNFFFYSETAALLDKYWD